MGQQTYIFNFQMIKNLLFYFNKNVNLKNSPELKAIEFKIGRKTQSLLKMRTLYLKKKINFDFMQTFSFLLFLEK